MHHHAGLLGYLNQSQALKEKISERGNSPNMVQLSKVYSCSSVLHYRMAHIQKHQLCLTLIFRKQSLNGYLRLMVLTLYTFYLPREAFFSVSLG